MGRARSYVISLKIKYTFFILILSTQNQLYRIFIYWVMYSLVKSPVPAASQKQGTTMCSCGLD